jgi:hypothetical protein
LKTRNCSTPQCAACYLALFIAFVFSRAGLAQPPHAGTFSFGHTKQVLPSIVEVEPVQPRIFGFGSNRPAELIQALEGATRPPVCAPARFAQLAGG